MHEIHHTTGFILKSTESGEANKLFWIFTKEEGVVLAIAQSVRKEQSKLKGHLGEYSFGDFDLVKGKEFWRITSAQMKKDISFLPKQVQRLFGRTINIVQRLCGTEIEHKEIFAHLQNLFSFLETTPLQKESINYIDTLSLLTILWHLGYIEEDNEVLEFLTKDFNNALLAITPTKNKQLIAISTKALAASHL